MYYDLFLYSSNAIAIAEARESELHDMCMLDINKAFTQLFGYSREDLIGRTVPEKFWPKDETEQRRQMLREALTGRLPSPFEGTRFHKDGTPLLVEIRLFLVPTGTRRPVVAASYTDLRQEKELERIRADKIRYEEACRIVAQIHHAINNPLTGILGISELLISDEKLSPFLRRELQTIESLAQRIQAATAELRKIVHGGSETELSP